MFGDIRMYSRFAFGLRRFFRETITLEEARDTIRRRLAAREDTFLRMVERGVFGQARSPYRPLFRMAGCEFGDLRDMVRKQGLEATLLALRAAGVYVSLEEFKGRTPMVREGKEFHVSDHDFDNPYLKEAYTAETGGSTGAGTRVTQDLDHMADRAPHQFVSYDAYGIADAPMALWRGVLPDGSGINNALAMSRCGHPPAKWFSPLAYRGIDLPLLRFQLATNLTVLISRTTKTPIPWPEHVPTGEPLPVARWLVATAREYGHCSLHTVASRALRVAVAAREAGLDLTGVAFIIGGEPVTPAKVRGIEASGARQFAAYSFAEAGRVGIGCCHPVSSNDLHLLTDLFAIVPFDRVAPGTDETVPAFNVTGLSPSSPKILINCENDDYGVVETRRCGCPLEELGLTTHVRDIRSYRKLTGEGVTMIGSEMLHVIESVLPGRFGGSPLDYQLMEEEDEDGFTRLSLAVSPRVPIASEQEVIDAFLEAVGKESLGAFGASYTWGQAGTIRIKRVEPVVTARGKLLPLHIPKRHTKAIPK